MTHLRQIMLEELRRRNYAESTIHTYIHTVEHFSRHFHRSPDPLAPILTPSLNPASPEVFCCAHYFLSEVWRESGSNGKTVPTSRREQELTKELQLAKDSGGGHEEVIVAFK